MCIENTKASTCLQVSKSPEGKPGGSMQKKLSVPRGRSNSISYKPYMSILPLKDIKVIKDILSSFENPCRIPVYWPVIKDPSKGFL